MDKPASKRNRVASGQTSSALGGTTGGNPTEEWYLESKIPGARGVNRTRIERLPFRVGRRPEMDLTLASRSVSGDHAELYWDEGARELRVRDLGSTNGTFVNNQRVTHSLVMSGDILHFADVEFRVGCERDPSMTTDPNESRHTIPLISGRQVPHNFIKGAVKIADLLHGQAYVPVFQPIVRLSDRTVFAYEALTRGRHPDLPENPNELFLMAAELGLEAELSRAFRRTAVKAIADHPQVGTLFLNSHPEETVIDIVRSAAELRHIAPRLELVLEVHEKALVDGEKVRRLKTELSRHGVRLAYDDFGAGQARVVELAEVPPDYLKFDIDFIRNIDRAPESKRLVLRSIVAVATDLKVVTVAEGVETEGEAEACVALGFTHAQGYLFGRGTTDDLL